MRRTLFILVIVMSSCTTMPTAPTTAESDVNALLDNWHKAASVADEAAYFGVMAPEFVFLGTDATERWDLARFRDFAHPYFAKGTAWTFVPRSRHVMFSPRGDVAWFDEVLDSASYGECRGSGVVRRMP